MKNYRAHIPQNLVLCNILQKFTTTSATQGCARFAEIASELTKAWSSGATEFGV